MIPLVKGFAVLYLIFWVGLKDGDPVSLQKLHYTHVGGQLSRVVKASDLGAEGPRFEPWQQHLVLLS